MESYIGAFIIGGIICTIAQILIDKTTLTPAKILVTFITIGTILGALGIYEKIVEIGGAGATVPLPGFGYSLSKAVKKEVIEKGILGAFTGGIKGAAGGIAAAIFFGYIMAVIFNSKPKG